MSFVAKVFVVLNLIVSCFFLMFATYEWTAQTKWQKMYEIEKTRTVPVVALAQQMQLKQARSILLAEQRELHMREERDKHKRDFEEQREANMKLIADVTKANNDRDLADNERKEELRENKRLIDNIDKMHNIVTKLQTAYTVAVNNAQTYKNEKADLESELNGTKATLSTANRDLKTAQAEASKQSNMIEMLIAKGINVYDILGEKPVQPAMEAKVLAVRGDVGLVMLSVGSSNGVKPGFQFMVSSGGNFKAEVQVEKVYPDMCSAKIKAETLKPGVMIEVNDEAQTR